MKELQFKKADSVRVIAELASYIDSLKDDNPVISSGMYVAGALFEHLTPAEQRCLFRDNFLRLTGYDVK